MNCRRPATFYGTSSFFRLKASLNKCHEDVGITLTTRVRQVIDEGQEGHPWVLQAVQGEDEVAEVIEHHNQAVLVAGGLVFDVRQELISKRRRRPLRHRPLKRRPLRHRLSLRRSHHHLLPLCRPLKLQRFHRQPRHRRYLSTPPRQLGQLS